MKRFFMTFLVLLTIVTIHASDFIYDGISYTILNNNEVKIDFENFSEERKFSGRLFLPDYVSYRGKTYEVTEIEQDAFAYKDIVTVTLPKGLKKIGYCAFWGCKSLIYVDMSESVETIESCAFGECTSLVSMEIPKNVTVINRGVFVRCTTLNMVILHGNVTLIDYGAFLGCKNLTLAHLYSRPKIAPNSFEGTRCYFKYHD